MTRWRDKVLTSSELKHASVRGGMISFASQLVKFIVNITVTIWLAHLLVPEDFGLVAMVMVVVNFFAFFKDAGFSAATVQQKVLTHEQAGMLFWLSTLIGFSLGLLLYFSAPVVALFFHESRLIDIMQVMTLIFFVGGLGLQHEALMQRKMRFQTLALIEVTSLLLASTTAVYLAQSGYAYWAMVWMQVIAIVVRVVLLWLLSGWCPSLPILRVGVRRMVVFGGQLTIANVIHYLSRHSDQILLGWWSGAHALGIYATTMQLVVGPLGQVLSPLSRVAVVTLSRLQSEGVKFRDTYLLLVKMIAYLTMPLMTVLAVLAAPVVHLFLGSKWVETIPIVTILACVGWILPVNYTMSWILTARGEGKKMLWWNMVMAPITVLVFFCSLPWGVSGMAIAFGLLIYASRYFHFRYVLKGSPISSRALYGSLIWPACLSFILALVAYVVKISMVGYAEWSVLLVCILCVLVVLVVCVRWLVPVNNECLEIWKKLQVTRSKDMA